MGTLEKMQAAGLADADDTSTNVDIDDAELVLEQDDDDEAVVAQAPDSDDHRWQR